MNINIIGGMESECCGCEGAIDEPSYGCEERKLVFTKREQEVLRKIRDLSLQARSVKERINGMAPGDSGLEEARRELESLRTVRKQLELERVAAAEERMRLLGHIQTI